MMDDDNEEFNEEELNDPNLLKELMQIAPEHADWLKPKPKGPSKFFYCLSIDYKIWMIIKYWLYTIYY